MSPLWPATFSAKTAGCWPRPACLVGWPGFPSPIMLRAAVSWSRTASGSPCAWRDELRISRGVGVDAETLLLENADCVVVVVNRLCISCVAGTGHLRCRPCSSSAQWRIGLVDRAAYFHTDRYLRDLSVTVDKENSTEDLPLSTQNCRLVKENSLVLSMLPGFYFPSVQ